MNKIYIYLIVFFNITTLSSCWSQGLDSKQLEGGYNSLGVNFINNKDFKEFRHLALSKIEFEHFSRDTLIFIEYFIDVTGNYSFGLYESGKISCYDIVNQDVGKTRTTRELRQKDICGLTPYIIKSIKEGNLKDVLDKGEKQRFTPNTTIIITIAKKEGKDYNIKAYRINHFKL